MSERIRVMLARPNITRAEVTRLEGLLHDARERSAARVAQLREQWGLASLRKKKMQQAKAEQRQEQQQAEIAGETR